MIYPAKHFPGTPKWGKAAVEEAVKLAGLNADKWVVPLEAIGRYESNWSNSANLCISAIENMPVGAFQLSRGMFAAAKKQGLITTIRIADPELSALVAVHYIQGDLVGYGGYDGIGTPDGKVGLVPRTDRGPGNVLRSWISDPTLFDVENARSLYRGY